MGLNPRQKLARGKWFSDVIVDAGLEGFQNVFFLILRRQHHHDAVNAFAAEQPHQLNPADFRQHPVDNHDIKAFVQPLFPGAGAVWTAGDVKPGVFQIIADQVADAVFILN